MIKTSNLALVFCMILCAYNASTQTFTHQDTLRGSITPQRAWWDLKYYDLSIDFDIDKKFIKGSNTISFDVITAEQTMQIDLQEPLNIDSVVLDKKQKLNYNQEGNAWHVNIPQQQKNTSVHQLNVFFSGKLFPYLL